MGTVALCAGGLLDGFEVILGCRGAGTYLEKLVLLSFQRVYLASWCGYTSSKVSGLLNLPHEIYCTEEL